MMQILLFVLLASGSAAGLAYVLLAPRMATDRKRTARLGQYARMETDRGAKQTARDRVAEGVKRRKTIQNSLKEIEDRQKAQSRHLRRLPLKRRIEQAGLSLSERQFILYSFAAGMAGFLVTVIVADSPFLMVGGALVAGIGLPRFVLGFIGKRRQRRFIDEFPNAIDLVVRGIRSGLPVNDTFKMIATESSEPVRSEFQKVCEALQLGLPASEAIDRLYQSMPMPETNFFAIVISIQAQAGGNLAEALGNLSRVLRDRRKMKGKIQAMSMEAKSSAGIIGSLPIVVGLLLYLTTPAYVSVLFTHPTGQVIILGGLVWMSMGILVMRRMINFDF